MFNQKILKILDSSKRIQCVRYIAAQNAEKRKVYKMNAWQIHSYGDLSELQLTKARIPCIRNPSDLLIEVRASSLNPIDQYMMHGYGKTLFSIFRCNELEFPLTLGRDFAGIIVDKGHDVRSNFNVGDKVYGLIPLQNQGAHAELVVANESNVLTQPEHLSAVEASSLLYAAMTAWSSLYITGELLLRDPYKTKVLILGASGGVGSAAVQLLKSQKAIVFATCSTDAVPLVTSLGADDVFDYKNPKYEENLLSQGEYDIILDCAKHGHENLPSSIKYSRYLTLNSPLLTNTDKYGLIGGLAASLNSLISTNIANCRNGKSVRWSFILPIRYGLDFVDNLIKRKQINPVIHKVFKFEEMPKAYEALAAGHLRGKIVIDMKNI